LIAKKIIRREKIFSIDFSSNFLQKIFCIIT